MHGMNTKAVRTMALYGVMVAASLACNAGPDASQVQAESAPPRLTSTPAPSLSDAELRRSTRFRGAFSLRSGSDWISTVVSDPTSTRGVIEFGVPLLPVEIDELLRRTHSASNIVDVIRDYSITIPDDWVGVVAGPAPEAIVIVKVSRDKDWHQEVLGRLLPEGARFDVRLVEQSADELLQFAARVRADHAWFETIGTRLLGVEVKPVDGIVDITYTGLDSSRSADIVAHFGGSPWIRTTWTMPPPWTGGHGAMIVEATDRRGQPVRGLECIYGAIDPVARYGMSFGYSTNDKGQCEIEDLPATAYDVELWFGSEGNWTTVGTGRVELRTNRSTTVRIAVDLP